MKSGWPGTGWCLRQPVMPAARRMDASFSSVSLLPRERMAAMTWLRFFFVNTSATRTGCQKNVAMSVPGDLAGEVLADDEADGNPVRHRSEVTVTGWLDFYPAG